MHAGVRRRIAQRLRKVDHRRAVRLRHYPLRRALPGKRRKSAECEQRRIALQLAQQRLRGLVLEDDAGQHRPPHRHHRIIVAPVPAPLFERVPVAGAGVRGAVRHPPRRRVGCLRPSCRSLRGTGDYDVIPILAHDGHKHQGIVSYQAEKYCNDLNSRAWAAWGGNAANRAKFAGLTAYSGDSWGEENLNAVERSTSQWVRTAQRPQKRNSHRTLRGAK